MSMPVDNIIENAYETDVGAARISEETLAESGFYWRERGGVRVLVCARLEQAGFLNGFSTRNGGVSPFPSEALNLAGFDEDSAENIYENRRRFLAAVGGTFELATVWQVHGNAIKIVDDLEAAKRSDERADGLASNLSGILLGVKTADCVPILIADAATGAFAAVHAGWRGTVQSIVERAVGAMQERFGSNPAGILAAIGPAAGCGSYEVGSDVIEAFSNAFDSSSEYFTPTRKGHALIDLHRANRDQLSRAGVSLQNIFTAPFCTMERNDLFFSYRKEKARYGKTGRLLSVIGRIA